LPFLVRYLRTLRGANIFDDWPRKPSNPVRAISRLPIWVFTPALGWWGAAALSLLAFTAGHAYQGWSGASRSAVAGTLFTLLVLATGSLIPAMLLHALIDAGSGVIAWLVLRDEPVNGEFAGAGACRSTHR
jgi:hypothetical protein